MIGNWVCNVGRRALPSRGPGGLEGGHLRGFTERFHVCVFVGFFGFEVRVVEWLLFAGLDQADTRSL